MSRLRNYTMRRAERDYKDGAPHWRDWAKVPFCLCPYGMEQSIAYYMPPERELKPANKARRKRK